MSGDSAPPPKKKRHRPTRLEMLDPAFGTGEATIGYGSQPTAPRRPGSRVGKRKSGTVSQIDISEAPDTPIVQPSLSPPTIEYGSSPKRKPAKPRQGLLSSYTPHLRASLGRRRYETLNPRKGGRKSPDEPEPVEEKTHEATVTLGLPATGKMSPWEQQKQKGMSQLSPSIQRLAAQNPDWSENMMRDLDRIVAVYNLERRKMQHESGNTSKFYAMTIAQVLRKKSGLLQDTVDRHVKRWRLPTPKKKREKSPSPEPELPDRPDLPAPKPVSTPEPEFAEGDIPESPVPWPSEWQNPATDLFDSLSLPEVPDIHPPPADQMILPPTAALRSSPSSVASIRSSAFGGVGSDLTPGTWWNPVMPGEPPRHGPLVPYSQSVSPTNSAKAGRHGRIGHHPLRMPQHVTPGQHPSGGDPARSLSSSSMRSLPSTATSELINQRQRIQAAQTNTLPERRGVVSGSIRRSRSSTAASFDRARRRMLNVPRGLQKSKQRGMQVLKRQNFHIEQQGPNNLILHARIVNSGVIDQIRALVTKITRPILVENQKVPKKQQVNHIAHLLEKHNHVRITVVDS